MTAKVFLKNCREMTCPSRRFQNSKDWGLKDYARWSAFFDAEDRLFFARTADLITKQKRMWPIVSAVGVDVLGSRIKDPNDVWEAAMALKLGKEFARLVISATHAREQFSSRAIEVRQEVLAAVFTGRYPLVDARILFDDRYPIL